MSVVSEQFSDLQYQFIWDQASTTITYFGEAQPGTPTSAAAWRLRRLDTTTGIVLKYAEGTPQFQHIWDNRASLSY
jgi:hypothetical protein